LFDGETMIANGKDIADVERVSITAGTPIGRDQSSSNAIVVINIVGGGGILYMNSPTSFGARKFIKNCSTTANTLSVIDSFTGNVVLVLAQGQSGWIVADGGRWY
jgi:hypothetical protein